MSGSKKNVIGVNIKQIRLAKKMTQKQLMIKLELLNSTITCATISKIENGMRAVSDAEVVLFAKALGVSYDDLFKTKN